MKLFADTASLDEIKYCFTNNVNDGITTNPKIMEATGDLSRGFEAACTAILEKYPNVPVSLETDLGGMDASELDSRKEEVKSILLNQAYSLAKLGSNVVVKIPVCSGGLMAVKELSRKGIKTNVTACMTPYQALEAASAGATYVSLFANRMLDCHIIEMSGTSLNIILKGDWKAIAKEKKEQYFEKAWQQVIKQISYTASMLEKNHPKTELIIGSIRTPEDLTRISSAEPHIITIPTKIVKEFQAKGTIDSLKKHKRTADTHGVFIGKSIEHQMTQFTLDEFEQAAMIYRK